MLYRFCHVKFSITRFLAEYRKESRGNAKLKRTRNRPFFRFQRPPPKEKILLKNYTEQSRNKKTPTDQMFQFLQIPNTCRIFPHGRKNLPLQFPTLHYKYLIQSLPVPFLFLLF